MKIRIVRHVFAALAGTALCTAMIGASQARSLPGFAGQPQNPDDYHCFLNGGGLVWNNCPGTKGYCMALPVDTAWHTVDVAVSAPSGSQIACQAESRYWNSAFAHNTTRQQAQVTDNGAELLSLGGLEVPAGGALYLCCDIGQYSTLKTVNF